MQIRINKYLSLCGVGSRRNIESMLWRGEFMVNGLMADPGQMIDGEKDVITALDGKVLKPAESFVYYALNKPKGLISTTNDELDRDTIMQLVKTDERLYPVGRLDKDSTGLILLTNDGDLALRLTHPRYHLPKTYEVTAFDYISEDKLRRMAEGVEIPEAKTMPAEVTRTGDKSFQIILHQGMKRQIREMCKVVRINLETLHRTAIGPIKLGVLKEGESRELTDHEKRALRLG